MSVSNIILSGNTSNHKGALQIPKLTLTERNLLTPSSGMLVYSLDDEILEYYNGTSWEKVVDQDTTQNPNFFLYSNALVTLPINTTYKIGEGNLSGNTLLFSGGGFTYNATNKTLVCPKNGKYYVSGTMTINDLTPQNASAIVLRLGITLNNVVVTSYYNSTTEALYPSSITLSVSGLLDCQQNDEISLELFFGATVNIAAEIGGGNQLGRGYLTYLNGYYIGN